MPMISMDGPENELAMVAIKNEITYIFYWSNLIFCNQNSAGSSMIHGEMHGGGRVVPSLMVVENGAIGFEHTFFSILAILSGEHRAWPQATVDASHSTVKKRVAPHFYGDGKQASEGVVVGMV